ncbi:MAG: hypothetical protein MUE30_18165 [Spirosomaceae bacterium]|jgi:hypothetical protein|nr:hypothetical protein [Spirosomataceae bacterium]
MKNPIATLLVGEYDNFQQAWQQNTETAIHLVKTDCPHRLVHTVVKAVSAENGTFDAILEVVHYTDRNPQSIIEHHIYTFKGTEMQVFGVASAAWSGFEEPLDVVQWQQNGDGWQADSITSQWKLSAQRLERLDKQAKDVFFNEASAPFRLLRCRFFSGWIEIPDPKNIDQIYRFPNLRLHDQGGKVQLRMADGALGKYTVELTQLVFGHSIPIVKLAVYELDSEAIEYNSYAVSYTWTNPEAQRIGINLRYITTGWTLEAAGLLASRVDSKQG